MIINVLEYKVIYSNTRQYLAIHVFMNSTFFRGIYVGMAIHVLEYTVIHDNTWQYTWMSMPGYHASTYQYINQPMI